MLSTFQWNTIFFWHKIIQKYYITVQDLLIKNHTLFLPEHFHWDVPLYSEVPYQILPKKVFVSHTPNIRLVEPLLSPINSLIWLKEALVSVPTSCGCLAGTDARETMISYITLFFVLIYCNMFVFSRVFSVVKKVNNPFSCHKIYLVWVARSIFLDKVSLDGWYCQYKDSYLYFSVPFLVPILSLGTWETRSITHY